MKHGNIEVINDIWIHRLGILKCIDTVTKKKQWYIGQQTSNDIEEDMRNIIDLGIKYTDMEIKQLADFFA